MLTYRVLTTALCTSLLALSACDKDESLGEVESETAGESESHGESETAGETTGGETDSDSGETGVSCPADAMICPDGSAVGRSGPDCEFDPCPGETGETGETGGPICAPDDAYFEPASCPSKNGNPYVIEPGCQTECLIETPNCGGGSVCMPVEVNPCVCDEGGECCGACAAGMTLCVPVSEGETCDAIVGQNFASIEQYECGLGKDGPVLCNWSVDFSAEGDYLWMYSDLGEGGTYACKDGAIYLANNSVLDISYDAESGILTWDGIDYTAQ